MLGNCTLQQDKEWNGVVSDKSEWPRSLQDILNKSDNPTIHLKKAGLAGEDHLPRLEWTNTGGDIDADISICSLATDNETGGAQDGRVEDKNPPSLAETSLSSKPSSAWMTIREGLLHRGYEDLSLL